MNTAVAERPIADIVDDVVARGDLSKLTAEQRVVHYHRVCESLGLNPATQPFIYLMLNGKLQLYARKDCTDQLRKINDISIAVVAYETTDSGILTVRVRATDKNGRHDEDFGVVSVAGLRGEALSNAMMKAMTKAKRRVTLSISGLGFTDESEIEDMTPTFSDLRSTPTLTKDSLPPQPAPKGSLDAADTIPHAIELHGDDWSNWCNTLITFVRNAPDAETINEWTTENFDKMTALQKADTAKATKLVDIINHEIEKRIKPDET